MCIAQKRLLGCDSGKNQKEQELRRNAKDLNYSLEVLRITHVKYNDVLYMVVGAHQSREWCKKKHSASHNYAEKCLPG